MNKAAAVKIRKVAATDNMPTVGTSGEYPETIFAYSHSGRVESAPVVKSESGKFPQLNRKANSAADTIPGINRGKVTSCNTCQPLQPISRAASSSIGSKLYARMAMISVAMGAIQTRCATIAVCHDGKTPMALNHINSASPNTVCGKKIGNNTSF